MIQDKIVLALQALASLKEDLKELKKDLKMEEKIDDETHSTLKESAKGLKAQVKDFEEEWMQQLNQDESYKELKELKMQKEEEIAEKNEELFSFIGQLPAKAFEMNMETELGPVRVQVQPEMRVYLNGREEKKRA
jgi:glutamine synthetase type III